MGVICKRPVDTYKNPPARRPIKLLRTSVPDGLNLNTWIGNRTMSYREYHDEMYLFVERLQYTEEQKNK
jgi:hypothetical protein